MAKMGFMVRSGCWAESKRDGERGFWGGSGNDPRYVNIAWKAGTAVRGHALRRTCQYAICLLAKAVHPQRSISHDVEHGVAAVVRSASFHHRHERGVVDALDLLVVV